MAQTAPQGDSNIELAKGPSNPVSSLISAITAREGEAQWGGRLTITLLFPT